jgi:hypothetical protein
LAESRWVEYRELCAEKNKRIAELEAENSNLCDRIDELEFESVDVAARLGAYWRRCTKLKATIERFGEEPWLATHEQGAREERAAIVGWLRSEDDKNHDCNCYGRAAVMIQDGEHLK